MASDMYSAVWVSHSSLCDYKKCPRAYYLKNIYKDPKTGHKFQIVTPSLSLGQAVHSVVESLSQLPTHKRFEESLLIPYEAIWKTLSGKRGGFFDEETEFLYKSRGEQMLRRVMNHPGPLQNLSVKIKQELPHFWLSEDLGIILCGKVDWLEYIQETDSVHIIDFKTGKHVEDGESLQLPIYYLLVQHTQKRTVTRASYWYLELHDDLTAKSLPDEQAALDQILTLAKRVKLARQLQKFECPTGGCSVCRPYEQVLERKAELVGLSEYNQDIYILPKLQDSLESELL